MSIKDTIADLTWRAYEGQLDESQAGQLTALLEGNSDHRQYYVQLMLLYTSLRWERTEGDPRDEETEEEQT